MRKDECQGCIGFDVPHTCEGWQEHQEILKHRHDCLKCGEKDKRIEELEAKLADALDRPEFVLHQMWQDAETKLAAHKKIQPYIQHKEDCELRVVHHAFESACDCGLDKILKGDKP